jgi:FkbM family methyltransferase
LIPHAIHHKPAEVVTKLFFDVGANKGDAVWAALNLKGFNKVVALEPAPKVFAQLVYNYMNDPRVIPYRLAASSTTGDTVEFYECVEDGLSTLNKEWLTSETSRYNGKEYATIQATTVKLDDLITEFGLPELIKIDVEGGEDLVLAGLTQKPPRLCFEWTLEDVDKHVRQLERLQEVNGYTEYALQYIEHHLEEPSEYRPISTAKELWQWITATAPDWENGGWKVAGLHPQADAGMIWVR